VLLLTLLAAPLARADVPLDVPGHVAVLPPHGAHQLWVPDPLLRRAVLVDVDSGRMLGMVNGGFGNTTPLFAPDGSELYVPETYYSRGSRGERTDVLTIYDAHTLAPSGEVVLPPKRSINGSFVGNAALEDSGRFAAVFNLTPATSLSIVDLRLRRFVAEVPTPGCSLAYAAGERRFASLCADGALLLIRLAPDGTVVSRQRSAPFFDPEADPVTEKGVRVGSRWIFASFEGVAHEVDLSGEVPRFDQWPLFTPAERKEGWRVGGAQHLAAHAASGRLYSLVHQGGRDTQKQSGTELWVYDLATHERVQRIELEMTGLSILGRSLQLPGRWNRLLDWIYSLTPGPGVDVVQLTRDAQPLIVTSSLFSSGLAIYDAANGHLLRRVYTGNSVNGGLLAPWGGAR